MTDNNTTTRLVINETVDGVAAKATAPDKTSRKTENAANAEPEKLKSDPYIWGIYILLLIISIVELYSASSTEVHADNVYGPLIRHGIFLGIGFLLVLGLQNVHYKWFKKYSAPIAIISLGLLALTSFTSIGANINGAQRAIVIAGITIQPPEIVKLTVMVWLASILAKNQMSGGVTTKGVIYAALVVMAFSGCTFKNGLTNTIIIMGVSLCMMLLGNIPIRKILIVLAVYAIGGGTLYVIAGSNHDREQFNEAKSEVVVQPKEADGATVGRSSTWMARIDRHMRGVKPNDKITDDNRQVIMASFAQANGGLIGQGPGNSRESARLPLAFSDYIYSIVVEDTGFVGGVCLMALYLFLIARAGLVAHRCSRVFPALLIMGCAVLIVLQAFIHMAIVTGVFPVSGQPLPFISKGGTSILVMSVAIGMMLSVSRFAVTSGNKKQIRSELRTLPEDLHAPNPLQIDPVR